MKTPTAAQGRIIQFMRDFLAKEDRMPSSHEIATHFGCAQTNALQHVRRLERNGMLEYRSSKSRRGGWWRFPRKEEAP